MKTGTKNTNLEDYIDYMTKQNHGQPTKLIGPNGFEMLLTHENVDKLKQMAKDTADKIRVKSNN